MLDHKNNIETTPCVDGASATNPVVSISVVFLWMQVLHACIARKSLKFTWKNFRLIFRFAILGCMWTYKKLLVAAAFGFHWRPIVFFFHYYHYFVCNNFFCHKNFLRFFPKVSIKVFNPFLPSVPFDSPIQPSVLWCFQGGQKETMERKWLREVTKKQYFVKNI